MPFGHVQDVEAAVLDFIDHGVSPARIVLFADHPEYPGYLQVEPVDPRARGVFYTTYHDWLSRHLILNGLHLLDQFVELLIEDDFIPLAGPSTARILEDHRRWSEPLAIKGYDLRKFQSFCLNQALERARTGTTNEERFYFLNWSAGSGKAEPVSEPVLTPTGWRTMGALRPGDHVIGSDGLPTRVIAIHPQGVRQVYRVEFNDGTFVRCDASHLWNVRKYSTRVRRATPSDPTRKTRLEESPWKTLTTRELMHSIQERPYARRWQIPPLSGPVIFSPSAALPVDPYMLGVILGDGNVSPSASSWSVCTDREIVKRFGWSVRPSGDRGEYTVTARIPPDVRAALTRLGLGGKLAPQKVIPSEYLTASPADRLALLQGLLDSDGHAYVGKTGVEFSTTSPILRDGVAELVRSLRGRATISAGRVTRYTAPDGRRVPGQESWRVSAVFPDDVMPFRLSRKANAYTSPVQRKTPHKIITTIRDEGVAEEQVCITVEAPDNLYVTRDYALTHNSFCAAAGARALLDEGLIDMVLACTLSKLKIGLMRNFTNVAGLDVWINDHSAKATRLRRYQEPRQGLVLNYEKLRVDFDALEEMVRGKRVLFVLDECHKVIAESGANQARKALDKLVRICTATIWPMSATVVGGSPLRFRDVFSLDGHPKSNPLGTKEDFVSRYAEKVTNIPIVTKSGGRFSITRYDWDLDALHEVRHRVGDRTMAVRKTDPGIREQFKGIECIPEWVPMTDELAAIYDLILADAKVARDEGLSRAPHYLAMRVASINPAALQFSTNDIAAQIWAEHPELCQAKFSAKIEMLNDRLESIRESQDKAIVFCHWTSMGILPLQHHLKVPYVLHYGTGQTARESQAAQDRFKADPDLTCFLTSDAGSHGLNMQEARYVINTDPLYSYDDLTQRNARIDRADSHLDGLTAYVMITEESKVENRIWQVCEQRRQLAEAVQGTREELTTAEVTAEESNSIDWLIGLED
ncbi:DarB-like antirestriction [Mycobacterium phage Cane17]|uniref:DNA helicase n=1 Tax=Mycobacterium phage Cane17 TaxID=2301548 RepID=A0A346N8X6_9CAUD|nr:DarB-like antirestriction [Mycobacterium phage Cane17]AXQ51761.1 DNA helicase [Mycobacterium phage Cane17]